MRVVRFPGAAESERAGLDAGAEIDAMLAGEVAGEESVGLRELHDDVRAIVGAPDADFERELQARVTEWGREATRARPSLRSRLAQARGRFHGTPGRLLALAGAGAAVAAVIVAVALSNGGGRTGAADLSAHETMGVAESSPVHATKSPEKHSEPRSAFSPAEASSGTTVESAPATSASGAAPGRLQQLAASVALATEPNNVQSAAEAVTRLGVSDGGYVESSHVQVRRGGGSSEAQLRLVIPSARLASTIVALGRIAPERAVNQESEDITSAYDSARRRLIDAEAVRRALLRELAAATTQGQIVSLRERLASARSQIAEYRSQVKGEAHRAATSTLEVTISESGSGPARRGTVDRGLHDAGHVLAVAAAVALVALAVLVPLALLFVFLDVLRRAWRRRAREAALD